MIIIGIAIFAAMMLLAAVLTLAAAGISSLRRIRQHHPQPDLAFLANCRWCAGISDSPGDCTCPHACEYVSYCIARLEAERG